MEFKCGSWKVMENEVYLKVQNRLAFFVKKMVKTYPKCKMKDIFKKMVKFRSWKLGEVMEKVMGSHGISKAQKSMKPDYVLVFFFSKKMPRADVYRAGWVGASRSEKSYRSRDL